MTQSEYLSSAEMHQLTGYARPTSQAVWLKNHSIPCLIDGRRVVVSRVMVQSRIEGKTIVSGGINFANVR